MSTTDYDDAVLLCVSFTFTVFLCCFSSCSPFGERFICIAILFCTIRFAFTGLLGWFSMSFLVEGRFIIILFFHHGHLHIGQSSFHFHFQGQLPCTEIAPNTSLYTKCLELLSDLGLTTFFTCTMERESSSSGQQTKLCGVFLCQSTPGALYTVG